MMCLSDDKMCDCMCHESGNVMHAVPCCCPHRYVNPDECPECRKGRVFEMSIEEDPTEDLHDTMYRLGLQHGWEKANYVRATEAERENRELRSLFEIQQMRMQEATAAWRAEWPEERELIMPDLGDLLTWLMEKAGLSPFDGSVPADLAQERAMTEESEEILAVAEEEGPDQPALIHRSTNSNRCTHPDDRGRECRHCGKYVRGDDNG